MNHLEITYERKKVYDPLLRLCHWGLAISICVLISTGLINDTLEPGIGQYFAWEVHIFAGYLFSGFLTIRLIWGIIGHEYAKWSNLFHWKIWKENFTYFKLHRKMLKPTQSTYGHDPIASIVYLGVYAVFIMMMLTGFILAGLTHDVGPFSSFLIGSTLDDHLFEEIHEFGFNVILAFVLVHIGALILHENQDNTPVAQSMISGYQYRVKPKQNESDIEN